MESPYCLGDRLGQFLDHAILVGKPCGDHFCHYSEKPFCAFGTDNALDMWGAWGFKEGIDEIDWVIMMN